MNNHVLKQLSDQIDSELRTPIPINDLKPPGFGETKRAAISACVDSIVDDLCKQIDDLHQTLNEIQQRALRSADVTKHAMLDHVDNCERLNGELARVREVVRDLTPLLTR